MKEEYFPYLQNNRLKDYKKYKYINDIMDKKHFTYLKKKYYFSNSGDITHNNLYSRNYLIDKANNNNNSYSNNYTTLIGNYIKKDQNLNGENVNQELLFFQNENDKNINLYNNFIKNKSLSIEAHVENYLIFYRNIIIFLPKKMIMIIVI